MVEIENIMTYEAAVQPVFLDYSEDVSRLHRNLGDSQRIRLELRHPRCLCNIKVQCKEVKTQQVYYL